MAKEKAKINFHDKEMGLFKARMYLLGLELGIAIVDLNEKEENDYLKWKRDKEEKNERAREIIQENRLEKLTEKENVFKRLTEKGYLIERLESQIKLIKNAKIRAYCEKHGHKEETYTPKGIEGAVTHYYCLRCGISYEKKSTSND